MIDYDAWESFNANYIHTHLQQLQLYTFDKMPTDTSNMAGAAHLSCTKESKESSE